MVLLVYEPSLDFIVSYLACLRAGVVAVPTYPPGAVARLPLLACVFGVADAHV